MNSAIFLLCIFTIGLIWFLANINQKIELINQFGFYWAEFDPLKTSDLKPNSAKIGSVDCFQAMWIIEEGPYIGEWAMMPKNSYYWVPSSDLNIMGTATSEDYMSSNEPINE